MSLRPACASLLVLLAGPALAAPAAPEAPAPGQAEPVTLASHKAVYDLSLASSGGARALDGARGRIVIDFRGDACRGYTMQTRQVTVLDSGEGGSRTSDLRNTTFEGGDGRDFRFKTTTLVNGAPSSSVDGTAALGDGLKVTLKEPKREQFRDAGEVIFPSAHMRRLVQAARAGQSTLSLKVFDGSDDGHKVYDTLAVIGREVAAPASAAQADRDKPLREGAMAGIRRWPVTLSYFTQGEGERTPIYTLGFDLYENGVSGALKLDYGDFAIVGDMTTLDLDKAQKPAQPCAQ
ncbi:cell envelope integrity EipB family protein [Methylobacterium sp. sgz302541]|uniref:cell envelope integrity EipB family protein n=1 Tax=unclassified Methylobacterium TaxID=2615210 RepID=UPI003D350539